MQLSSTEGLRMARGFGTTPVLRSAGMLLTTGETLAINRMGKSVLELLTISKMGR